MAYNEYKLSAVTDFRGPKLREEDTDLTLDAAKEAVNVSYERGQVATRYGFGQVWNPNEMIWSMYNWLKGSDAVSTSGNLLFYYNPTSGKVRYVPNLASPSPVDLFTLVSGAGAIHASAGNRLYTAVYNSSGEGQGPCRVSGGFDSVGTVFTDKCFPAPLSSAPTVSEPAAGVCTAGTKRVTYYLLSRSGHRGKLAPTSTITCSGDKLIRFSLTATWPADALSIWVVCTTSSNLNRYIAVPGATQTVPAGTSTTCTIDFSISDDDLLATGTEVTDYSLWMTQDGGGNGPFNPSHVFEIGTRMGYLTRLNGVSELYISEPAQYQQITADQHVLRLPGERKMTTAFATANGAVYILGPTWTYATKDTGEKPVLWPSPELVDGMIGTPSPTGAVFDPSRGIGFVADQGGLYAFTDGQYGSKPMSYGVASDWRRINWDYGYLLKVVDDKENNRVLVSAPIDGGTAPNAIFVFDYVDGLTYESIRYSFWTINNYYSGAIAMVLNPTTKRRELWLGSATTGGTSITGKVLRLKNSTDSTPYQDEGDGISWIYESAPFPNNPIGNNAHHRMKMRALGDGTASLTIYRLDHVSSVGPFTITLTPTPNNDIEKQFYLTNTPAVTYRYTGNTSTQSYIKLSKLEHYWKPFAP